jgi:hypothetical protein
MKTILYTLLFAFVYTIAFCQSTQTEYVEKCWRAYSVNDPVTMQLMSRYTKVLKEINLNEKERDTLSTAWHLQSQAAGKPLGQVPQRIQELEKRYFALRKEAGQLQAKVKLIKFEYTKKITPKS